MDYQIFTLIGIATILSMAFSSYVGYLIGLSKGNPHKWKFAGRTEWGAGEYDCDKCHVRYVTSSQPPRLGCKGFD